MEDLENEFARLKERVIWERGHKKRNFSYSNEVQFFGCGSCPKSGKSSNVCKKAWLVAKQCLQMGASKSKNTDFAAPHGYKWTFQVRFFNWRNRSLIEAWGCFGKRRRHSGLLLDRRESPHSSGFKMIFEYIREIFVAQNWVDFRKRVFGFRSEMNRMQLDPYLGDCCVFIHPNHRQVQVLEATPLGCFLVINFFEAGALQQKLRFLFDRPVWLSAKTMSQSWSLRFSGPQILNDKRDLEKVLVAGRLLLLRFLVLF